MGSFLIDFIDFVVLVLFLIGMARKIGSLFRAPQGQAKPSWGPRPTPSANPATRVGEMGRDPVCGMFVSTELSQKLRVGGNTIHFCSRECMDKYQKGSAHAAS
jgi:YHS domain-containing protein